MDNSTETTPAVAPKPLTGFQLHPENINKNGAPKKHWTMAGMIRDELNKLVDVKNDKGEVVGQTKAKRLVAQRLVIMAINGNMRAIQEVNNRRDGKAKQNIDITSNGGALTVANELGQLREFVANIQNGKK